MEKLELFQVIKYLPYDLIGVDSHGVKVRIGLSQGFDNGMNVIMPNQFLEEAKPILRRWTNYKVADYAFELPILERLLLLHYDVYGLIDKGLAIDADLIDKLNNK